MNYYKAEKTNLKKKTLRRLLWGVGVIFVMYLCFGGEYNLYKFWKLEQKKQEIFAKITMLELEKEQLSIKIERLSTDLAYIEKIAREEYNMGKKGEKIFISKDRNKK